MAMLGPHLHMGPGIFDDAYFPRNHHVRVETPYELIRIPYNHFRKIVPHPNPFLEHGSQLNLDALVRHITHHLGTAAYPEVLETLCQFFDILRRTGGSVEMLRVEVDSHLRDLLLMDINMGPYGRRHGLYNTRQSFRILACFAKHVWSDALASALAIFFMQAADEIINLELSTRNLLHWALAIFEIQKYLSRDDVRMCLKHLRMRAGDIVRVYRRRTDPDYRIPLLLEMLGHPQYELQPPRPVEYARPPPMHLAPVGPPRRHRHAQLLGPLHGPPPPPIPMPRADPLELALGDLQGQIDELHHRVDDVEIDHQYGVPPMHMMPLPRRQLGIGY